MKNKKDVSNIINKVSLLLVLSVILICTVFFVTNIIPKIRANLNALATNPSQAETNKFYIFPDGLTPVTHTYEYDFWLCQNEDGEYLKCTPIIEVRPRTDE